MYRVINLYIYNSFLLYKQFKFSIIHFSNTYFSNYSNPAVPEVPGIEKFRGMKIHSHDYRDSSVFKDKNTVVIGCGPSGLDISFDIAKVAEKVITIY